MPEFWECENGRAYRGSKLLTITGRFRGTGWYWICFESCLDLEFCCIGPDLYRIAQVSSSAEKSILRRKRKSFPVEQDHQNSGNDWGGTLQAKHQGVIQQIHCCCSLFWEPLKNTTNESKELFFFFAGDRGHSISKRTRRDTAHC